MMNGEITMKIDKPKRFYLNDQLIYDYLITLFSDMGYNVIDNKVTYFDINGVLKISYNYNTSTTSLSYQLHQHITFKFNCWYDVTTIICDIFRKFIGQ